MKVEEQSYLNTIDTLTKSFDWGESPDGAFTWFHFPRYQGRGKWCLFAFAERFNLLLDGEFINAAQEASFKLAFEQWVETGLRNGVHAVVTNTDSTSEFEAI